MSHRALHMVNKFLRCVVKADGQDDAPLGLPDVSSATSRHCSMRWIMPKSESPS